MKRIFTSTRAPLTLSLTLISLATFVCLAFTNVQGQTNPEPAKTPKEGGRNRDMGLRMLADMKDALKEHYYDPKYRGIDIDARFKAAEARIKTLTYNWEVYRVVAQVLLDFGDSHTRFLVPPRTDNFEYGFSFQMIGNDCFVTRIKEKSDAEVKGLKVGDQILAIGKYAPTRRHLWKIIYVLYQLDPIDFVELKIRGLDGVERHVTIKGMTMTMKEKRKEYEKRRKAKLDKPFKCEDFNAELIACKLYTFSVPPDEIDKMMKQVGKHSKLILDLRGNRGGYVVTAQHVLGSLFDRDVKIGEMVMREKKERRMAKTRKDKAFNGELVVLIDSNSASAAEVVARVVQIEKRGVVIGDLSSGKVMTSTSVGFFSHLGNANDAFYTNTGMSVTIADLIMSDGKRLEDVGVIPDVPLIPTGLALAQKTDPVLAYAVIKLGVETTPEKTGSLHFITAGEEDESAEDDKEGNR